MVTFRRPPRLPPPKPPKGKNVIPFPSDRVKPPGGTRLGDIVPDPPINLEQIRKAKELELRNAIQSEGMSPFPEGKGLSGLGEEVPVKTDIQKYIDAVTKQNQKEFLSDTTKKLHQEMKDILSYYNSPREPLKNLPLEDLVDDMTFIKKIVSEYTGGPTSVQEIQKLKELYSKILKAVKVKRIKEFQKYGNTPKAKDRAAKLKQKINDMFTKALGPIEDYPKKPEKFKGLKKDIKDLSGSMEKFGERNDPALDAISKAAKEIDKAGEASKKIIEASEARKGLSGLGEDLSLKGLARKVDTISKASESELKKAKKDIQDGLKGLKILEKADKAKPHIAEEQRQRNIKQKAIWKYMLRKINKRLSTINKKDE